MRRNGQRIDGLEPHQINRLGLSRSFQVTSIFARMTVFENIRCGLLWSRGYRYSFWHLLGGERALNESAARLLADVNLESRRDVPAGLLSHAEQRGGGRALTGSAARLLADVNLESRRDVPAGLLSYAEQRALEIGIIIAGGADTILLDEATARLRRTEANDAGGVV